jgi:hypothetical protein
MELILLMSGQFLVRYVKEVEWNPAAFDQVIIPDKHKHLLVSLVQGQNARRNAAIEVKNDIIEGKGKGLAVLLHGPPGV